MKASSPFSNGFDENSTVSFVLPIKGSIEDHFINYRLRADGIKRYDTSSRVESFTSLLAVRDNSYYSFLAIGITLKVVNCSETDRELPFMTSYGLLFPKSGEAG